MSQGCSSPRDLNIAPLAITAVTHTLIVTFWPRLCKRDLKLTHSLQMFFTRAAKQRQKHILRLAFFGGLWCYQSDSLSWYRFHSFVWFCLRFHLCCRRQYGRQTDGGFPQQLDSWTFLNTWCTGWGQSLLGYNSEANSCCCTAWTCWCCRPLLGHVWAVCSFTQFTFSSLTLDCCFFKSFAVLHQCVHTSYFFAL